MTNNQIEFMNYWEKNLKSKVSLQISCIKEAFFIYHQQPYTGSSCQSCMGQVARELKKIYEYLVNVRNNEIKMKEEAENLTNKLLERKPNEDEKINWWDDLSQEELEKELLTEKQRKYAPHIKKGIITKKINQLKNGEKETN